MHRSKAFLYSITSGARASSAGKLGKPCGARLPKSQEPKHCSANDRLGAGADGQLQKDTFDVRFHCLRRDLKSPSNALIGAALADHCQNIALPGC
jgi:hypothetical protein